MRNYLIGIGVFTISIVNCLANPSAIERVSVSTDGAQADDASFMSALSADGQYVAFSSAAANLVSQDTNSAVDIFVRDRSTGTTERVSVGIDGAEANAASGIDVYQQSAEAGYDYLGWFLPNPLPAPAYTGSGKADALDISADGRYVAFSSRASNLVAGDANGVQDIFVYDRQNQTSERISIASDGAEANGRSFKPSMSADGRYVAFLSAAGNLVAGDNNAKVDIFVRDRETGVTERVSLNSLGRESNGDTASARISTNGRFVVFSSGAANLIWPNDPSKSVYDGWRSLFVRDRATGTTKLVSNQRARNVEGMDMADISPDGRYVAFLGYPVRSYNWARCPWDTPTPGPYFQDRTTLIAIALDSDSYRGPGQDDPFGFSSSASCFSTGNWPTYTLIEPDLALDNEEFDKPYRAIVMSANQHYLVLNSEGAVKRYDRLTGLSEAASYDALNQSGKWSGWVTPGDTSTNGRIVSFTSASEQRLPDDNNGVADIFVADSGPVPATVVKPGANIKLEFDSGWWPTTISANRETQYTLIVTNKGPSTAATARLTANTPPGFKLLSVKTDLGQCKPGNSLDCSLGRLPMGAEARVTVQLRAGKLAGRYTIQAVNSFYVTDAKGNLPLLPNGKLNTKLLKQTKAKIPHTLTVTR